MLRLSDTQPTLRSEPVSSDDVPTSGPPTVTVVVVTYQRPKYAITCLEHLSKQTHAPDEIVLVDSSPFEETYELVTRRFPDVRYVANSLGYSRTAEARALGVAAAKGDVVAFVDDDAFAAEDWLEKLLPHYTDPQVGAVGGRTEQEDAPEDTPELPVGRLLDDGRLTGNFGRVADAPVDVDHLIGANMSFRRSALQAIGGIHGGYWGTCLREETDVCLRVAALGYRIVYTPFAVVEHVAAPHAKGRRFDVRYDYWAQHNHIVLLVRNRGTTAPVLRRYVAGSLRRASGTLGDRLRDLTRHDPSSSPSAAARSVAGAFARFGAVVVATPVGLVRGTRLLAADRQVAQPVATSPGA